MSTLIKNVYILERNNVKVLAMLVKKEMSAVKTKCSDLSICVA